MNIVDRVRNILITPRTEWEVIAGESTPTAALITGYVLPLAAIAAVAQFIGSVFVGTSLGFMGTFRMPLLWGLVMLSYSVAMAVVMVLVVGFIIDALAPSFGAQKDNAQALKVAAYCWTPGWVAGILNILPMLGILAILGALYGIYLLYLGLPRLMKNPAEKSAGYTAVVIICAIVVGVIVGVIGGLITTPAMMGAAAVSGMSPTAPAVQHDKSSPMGKLDDFAKKMEEAGRKMEAAQKSGDPGKQMQAAMEAMGTAMSGGTRVEPVSIEALKPFAPETFAGLPRTDSRAERSGVAGLMVAKVEASYASGQKQVELEITDTGGAAGLMGFATWLNVQGEKEDSRGIERTKSEGGRMIHERISRQGGEHQLSMVLGNRFVVTAEGRGIDYNEMKSAVAKLDLAKLEALK
jgi:hypothetical protein